MGSDYRPGPAASYRELLQFHDARLDAACRNLKDALVRMLRERQHLREVASLLDGHPLGEIVREAQRERQRVRDLASLRDGLRDLASVLDVPQSAEIVRERGQMIVVLAGPWNRGKSTMLSGLLGSAPPRGAATAAVLDTSALNAERVSHPRQCRSVQEQRLTGSAGLRGAHRLEGLTAMDTRYEPFCFADPVFYDSPERWVRMVDEVPVGWSREDLGGSWLAYRPERRPLPELGWKIHVYATQDNAESVWRKVSEYCFGRQLPFAVRREPAVAPIKKVTGTRTRSRSRLLTVYLDEADLMRTHAELRRLVDDEPGPYVRSELLYSLFGTDVFPRARRPEPEWQFSAKTYQLLSNGLGETGIVISSELDRLVRDEPHVRDGSHRFGALAQGLQNLPHRDERALSHAAAQQAGSRLQYLVSAEVWGRAMTGCATARARRACSRTCSTRRELGCAAGRATTVRSCSSAETVGGNRAGRPGPGRQKPVICRGRAGASHSRSPLFGQAGQRGARGTIIWHQVASRAPSATRARPPLPTTARGRAAAASAPTARVEPGNNAAGWMNQPPASWISPRMSPLNWASFGNTITIESGRVGVG